MSEEEDESDQDWNYVYHSEGFPQDKWHLSTEHIEFQNGKLKFIFKRCFKYRNICYKASVLKTIEEVIVEDFPFLSKYKIEHVDHFDDSCTAFVEIVVNVTLKDVFRIIGETLFSDHLPQSWDEQFEIE